ncbi:mitochondrial 50S ribosomal protein L41, putative [Pediculus humanus corporis]|uniref:Mitochondrial 50S ribosomal protein L41, putative n=1 Tax=Pediculus humanus subsp. corporis TaxID=121224 RepID=E0VLG9_PEDHC|nr:mitochondrial 50S ribosomal protein L41, putative [Pediculus humanus corporis]EEB14225.1 mitochondrial 50S ribosomal protein L41, putative [Pediculus humanus corporis]
MALNGSLPPIFATCIRTISTSSIRSGKKNFRQFPLYNFRGSMAFRKKQQENPHPNIPIYKYGVREPGYTINNKFHFVPEMIPEIIVPDLTDFTLKPYVSYRSSDIMQTEFTAKDLFDAIYSEKIQNDFYKGKLDEDGNSLEPNNYEKMTEEEAELLAKQTGSDIFG